MNAPAPSPDEQAVIDRFGIFDEELLAADEATRAMFKAAHPSEDWLTGYPEDMRRYFRRLAAAAVAAYRATRDGGAEEAVRGADLIAAERQRQIDAEGWTPEHDAEHENDDLAMAAVCYAFPPFSHARRYEDGVPFWWPWRVQDWKPTPDDRVRELVKAGALIAAEIDRLQASR